MQAAVATWTAKARRQVRVFPHGHENGNGQQLPFSTFAFEVTQMGSEIVWKACEKLAMIPSQRFPRRQLTSIARFICRRHTNTPVQLKDDGRLLVISPSGA